MRAKLVSIKNLQKFYFREQKREQKKPMTLQNAEVISLISGFGKAKGEPHSLY